MIIDSIQIFMTIACLFFVFLAIVVFVIINRWFQTCSKWPKLIEKYPAITEPDDIRSMISGSIFIILCLLLSSCSSLEQQLLFYPTHLQPNNILTPWVVNNQVIGYSRQVDNPENIWLMLHGNGGQASDRIYAIPCFSENDSIFILEYPGYGNRPGTPSEQSFNQAASDAYQVLKRSYPKLPLCIVGESIGSGPACFLATQKPEPDKLVLIVPYDKLSNVAKKHAPSWIVNIFLVSNWNNIEALKNYKGPIDIYAADKDRVIPPEHAQELAKTLPHASFSLIKGGHNSWSWGNKVKIRKK